MPYKQFLLLWTCFAPHLHATSLRDDLAALWATHRRNPRVEIGQTIEIAPIAGPMDMAAIWDDGMTGTASLYEPTPYHFLGFVDADWMRVQDVRFGDTKTISRHFLPQLVRRRRRALKAKLNILRGPQLRFTTGQAIRYRRQGLMRNGEVAAIENSALLIRDGDQLHRAPIRDVFYRLIGPARTVRFFHYRNFNLGVPRGVGLEFLNAVARWSSRAEFRALGRVEQISMLAKLVATFTPWHTCGYDKDTDTMIGLNDILIQGHGVCRHLSPIVNLVLNEAGFDAKIWQSEMHAWVEVDDLVVDANVDDFDRPVLVVRRNDLDANKAFTRDHYLSAQREWVPSPCAAELVQLD